MNINNAFTANVDFLSEFYNQINISINSTLNIGFLVYLLYLQIGKTALITLLFILLTYVFLSLVVKVSHYLIIRIFKWKD